jgi:predicted dehydrogenase
MNKTRFGVIGCGYIAKKAFIPAIKKFDNAELIAVASHSKEKSKSYAQIFNCSAENNYKALVSRGDIDAVYIATPPATHEEIAIFSARNGKHILCEKPLAHSFESTRNIIDESKDNNIGILEGFMYQFHSQHKVLKDLIDKGRIGEPKFLSAQFGIPPLNKNNYRYSIKSGGGALLDLGSYTVHISRKFFNREPEKIYSILKYEGEVDVNGAVLLDYYNGCVSSLVFGFNNYYQNNYSVWGTE